MPGVALHERVHEGLRRFARLPVVETEPRPPTCWGVHRSGQRKGMALVVEVAALRGLALEPVRRVFENDVHDHVEVVLECEIHQLVELVEADGLGATVHPTPTGPELDRVHPVASNQREITWPISSRRIGWTEVLGSEDEPVRVRVHPLTAPIVRPRTRNR